VPAGCLTPTATLAWQSVSAESRIDRSDTDSGTGTLGELLYADKARHRVAEADWVARVQAVAAGDQLALQELYASLHRIVFTLIMRITGNRQSAEELTLDVFHDVWRRASSYDPGGGSVVGWIMNQARSRAIDRLRSEQRKKRQPPDGNGLPRAALESDSEEVLDRRRDGSRLRQALVALTAHEREAIETAYFAGLTHTEVAAQLNQPVGTIKTRIRSGLEKLRQALSTKVEP
jgi:RNA polymerase sigma-70 factor, ECF subfamily